MDLPHKGPIMQEAPTADLPHKRLIKQKAFLSHNVVTRFWAVKGFHVTTGD